MKNEINEDTINLSQKSVLNRFGMAAASAIVITAVMALGTTAIANHKPKSQDNVTQSGQGTGAVNGQGSGAANGTGNTVPVPVPVPDTENDLYN